MLKMSVLFIDTTKNGVEAISLVPWLKFSRINIESLQIFLNIISIPKNDT